MDKDIIFKENNMQTKREGIMILLTGRDAREGDGCEVVNEKIFESCLQGKLKNRVLSTRATQVGKTLA